MPISRPKMGVWSHSSLYTEDVICNFASMIYKIEIKSKAKVLAWSVACNCEASLRLRKFRTYQLGLLVECCAVEELKRNGGISFCPWLTNIDIQCTPILFLFLFCMLVESIIIIAQSCLPQSHSALKYWHPHLTRMMYNRDKYVH